MSDREPTTLSEIRRMLGPVHRSPNQHVQDVLGVFYAKVSITDEDGRKLVNYRFARPEPPARHAARLGEAGIRVTGSERISANMWIWQVQVRELVDTRLELYPMGDHYCELCGADMPGDSNGICDACYPHIILYQDARHVNDQVLAAYSDGKITEYECGQLATRIGEVMDSPALRGEAVRA